VKLNKPCELEDFRAVEAIALIRALEPELTELYPQYPAGKEHRKSWEYQQIIRGAARLRMLGDHTNALCFPAGHDRTVYELTNRAHTVFACDVYGAIDNGTATCDPFLIDTGAFARQRYHATRLFARHMDARFLRFEACTFDLVVCPAFSAYPRTEESAGNLLLEFERVLRPGGVLVLCVELIVNGTGAANAGAELYDTDTLGTVLAWAANLQLVEPVQNTVSRATIATAMPLEIAKEDAARGESKFPHIILEADGRQFTTATVFIRKLG
jgi:SAM-dependent methyltransferase